MRQAATSVIIHYEATFDGDKTAFPRRLYASAGSFTSAAYKRPISLSTDSRYREGRPARPGPATASNTPRAVADNSDAERSTQCSVVT